MLARALAWRLGIAAAAAVALLVALMGRSYSWVKLVSIAAPAASLVAALGVVVAMHVFSQQPRDSAGRRLAAFAFFEMSIAVVLEGYGFYRTLQLHTTDMSAWSSMDRARDTAETVQTVSMWAMGLGFCALFVLLGSFVAVARHLRRDDVGDRVWGVAAMLVVSGAAVLGFRWHVYSDGANISSDSLILIGLGVMAFALAMVISYISVIRDLERALRAEQTAELPEARVTSG